jgi:hypothetical protein
MTIYQRPTKQEAEELQQKCFELGFLFYSKSYYEAHPELAFLDEQGNPILDHETAILSLGFPVYVSSTHNRIIINNELQGRDFNKEPLLETKYHSKRWQTVTYDEGINAYYIESGAEPRFKYSAPMIAKLDAIALSYGADTILEDFEPYYEEL